MKSVKLTPINDALALLLQSARVIAEVQSVSLNLLRGRVLAESLVAGQSVPAFDNSAMDGYAISTADYRHAAQQLPVASTAAAGHPIDSLTPGTVVRIFTGAPIPQGADAVVMQENTQRVGDTVSLLQQPVVGENIRRKGHDIAAGSVVLAAGKRLLPQDIGLIASLGLTSVKLMRPLVVAIVNTGDEVVAPGAPLRPGQLYDSNSFTLTALLEELGITVKKMGIVADDLAQTELALREAAMGVDCVISTGGVSVGEADFVKAAVEKLGILSLWKLAIKPGKPFSFGKIADTPFFGLPGNPVAVFVTFMALVKPYLLKMQGCSELGPSSLIVQAGFENDESGTRQEYLRVRLSNKEGELPIAELYPDQSSSVLTSLSWAEGLVVVPVHTKVERGQLLQYLPFRGAL